MSTPDGSHASPADDPHPTAHLDTERAARLRAESELGRTTRALEVLAACKHALRDAEREDQLLDAVCALLVEHGGYRLAWVGVPVDDGAKSVRVVARAGDDANALDRLHVSWADASEWGQGPTGVALRTRQPAVLRDVPASGPWQQVALEFGYVSAAALPLVCGGTLYGVLVLYDRDAHAFDATELAWLTALADDLAHGFDRIRTHHAWEKAQHDLRERFKELRCLGDVQRLLENPPPTEELCRQIADCLVPAMQFPELTVAAVEMLGRRFASSVEDSPPRAGLEAPIRGHGTVRGRIHVYYRDEIPFIVPEEQNLIDGVARVFGLWLEREDAQAALRIRQSQLRLLAENAADVIWTMDVATQLFTFLTPSVQLLLGYSPEELIGEPVARVLTPESARKVAELIASDPPVTGAPPSRLEVEHIRKDGTLVTAEFSYRWAEDESGRLQAVGVSRDTSERRRADEALRRSESSLELAQAIAHLGSWEFDPSTQSGHWSKEMFRIFGFDPAAGVPPLDEYLDRVRPEDRVSILAAHEAVMSTGDQRQVRYSTVPLNGDVRHIEALYYPVKNEAGIVVRVAGTVLDITEHERQEAQTAGQLEELRRWHHAMLGRESRVVEVKREVNALLAELGRPPRYPGADGGGTPSA